MSWLGSMVGYVLIGTVIVGALALAVEWMFRRKPVFEERGWHGENRPVRRKDRSIVFEGDADDPVVARRRPKA